MSPFLGLRTGRDGGGMFLGGGVDDGLRILGFGDKEVERALRGSG